MESTEKRYDIFLSYRREGGIRDAMLLKNALEDHGYTVFLDMNSLHAGQFDEQLYQRIDECTDFILVLPPNALNRCVNENDWVRMEIEHAHKGNKNIIPIMLDGFSFPDELPESIEFIRRTHGLKPSFDYFDAFIDKLTNFLKSSPHTLEDEKKTDTKPPFPVKWVIIAAGMIIAVILGIGIIQNHADNSIQTAYPAEKTSQTASTKKQSPANTGAINTLMQDSMPKTEDPEDAASAYVFSSPLLRKSIESITFLDNHDSAPDDAWDFSAAGDKSVLGWAQKTSTGFYDLFIAGNGGVNAPVDCDGIFNGYINLKEINFHDTFHTDQVKNMAHMFFRCPKLTDLDLSGFNTSNVNDMQGMFCISSGLKRIQFGNQFDTSTVASMTSMFYGCESLEELDVSGFRTDNTESMHAMFLNCRSLKNLDVSGFNTAKVKYMSSMFYGCSGLTSLNVSNFDTSNVINMSNMFSGCTGLSSLEVSNFDTSRVTEYNGFMPDSLNPDWRSMFEK